MPSVINYLRKFNRKERFFLVGWALGNPDFVLGAEFRSKLQDRLDLQVPIAENAFVAMDYHLEWLYASLVLAASGGRRDVRPNPPRVPDGDAPGTLLVPLIRGNQEDIDLLISFEVNQKTYLLMIEAKGATGFLNRQLASKVARLTTMFEDPAVATLPLEPRFAIASPTEPRRIRTGHWRTWMLRANGKPWWLEMPFAQNAWVVSRCDPHGTPTARATHWLVIDAARPVSPRPPQTPGPARMGASFASIHDVGIGQLVTYRSTVTGEVQVGTVGQVNATSGRVLVTRPTGRAGWMSLRTIGHPP